MSACGCAALDDLEQIDAAIDITPPPVDVRRRSDEGTLEVDNGVLTIDEQPIAIDEPHLPPSLLRHDTSHLERRHELVGDAHSCRAGSDDDGPQRRDGLCRDLHPGDDRRRSDRSGSLDVVVERADAVAVAIEQTAGVALSEVLPVQQHPRTTTLDHVDELVDEDVVLLAAGAKVAATEVQGIRQQRLVVGADVEGDRQGGGGIDTSDRRVQRELPDRDPHATGAEVAETEDPFAVGDHDQPDIVHLAEDVAHQLVQAADVAERDVQAVLTAVDARPLLTREANGGRVHDGQQLGEVISKEPVEQHGVPFLHQPEEDVAVEIVLVRVVLDAGPDQLRIERFDRRWQQSVQSIAIAPSAVKAVSLFRYRLESRAWPRASMRRQSTARRCYSVFASGAESGRETADSPPLVLLHFIAHRPAVHACDVATLHEEGLTGERTVGSDQIGDERRDVGRVPRVEATDRRLHDVLEAGGGEREPCAGPGAMVLLFTL